MNHQRRISIHNNKYYFNILCRIKASPHQHNDHG